MLRDAYILQTWVVSVFYIDGNGEVLRDDDHHDSSKQPTPSKINLSFLWECEGCIMKRSSLTLSPRTPEYNVDLFFQSAGDVAASTQGCAQRCKWGKGGWTKTEVNLWGSSSLKKVLLRKISASYQPATSAQVTCCRNEVTRDCSGSLVGRNRVACVAFPGLDPLAFV